jgi:hypothetical protein
MAQPHDTHNHEVFQEHPMIKERLAELQTIDDTTRVAGRFYELIDGISHSER